MKIIKILTLFVLVYLLFITVDPVLGVAPPEPFYASSSPNALESLENFQKNLKNCAQTGDILFDCWISGSDQVDKRGSTGVFSAIGNSLLTSLIGPISQDQDGHVLIQDGALSSLTNLIIALYQPPVSSKEYFAYLGKKLNIIKPAYAQGGTGFTALNSILNLWNAFKNVSYIFFIIVFIATGFAVMFRTKINPQTTISIQNALPRIVVALILVTFSYAIAGFLIDLSYVLFFLAANSIHTFGGITDKEMLLITGNYTTASLLDTLAKLGLIGYNNLKNLLNTILPGIADLLIGPF